MNFQCINTECPRTGQMLTVWERTVTPINVDTTSPDYEQFGDPYFFTVPPVYCGVCRVPASEVTD